jgi:Mg-chelatase subunit ChlI
VVLVNNDGNRRLRQVFADRWTTNIDAHEPEDKWVHTKIIKHIIELCGFSPDSLMVRYMDQQQWSELEQVVMTTLDEIK